MVSQSNEKSILRHICTKSPCVGSTREADFVVQGVVPCADGSMDARPGIDPILELDSVDTLSIFRATSKFRAQPVTLYYSMRELLDSGLSSWKDFRPEVPNPSASTNTATHTIKMGSSHSSLNPRMVRKEQLQCDSSGRARFRIQTIDGQPAIPGYYKIICNLNFNDDHVVGTKCNGERTRAEFNRIIPRGQGPRGNTRFFRYRPGQNNTPFVKGFEGNFVAMPNRTVMFECWWFPLDGELY